MERHSPDCEIHSQRSCLYAELYKSEAHLIDWLYRSLRLVSAYPSDLRSRILLMKRTALLRTSAVWYSYGGASGMSYAICFCCAWALSGFNSEPIVVRPLLSQHRTGFWSSVNKLSFPAQLGTRCQVQSEVFRSREVPSFSLISLISNN